MCNPHFHRFERIFDGGSMMNRYRRRTLISRSEILDKHNFLNRKGHYGRPEDLPNKRCKNQFYDKFCSILIHGVCAETRVLSKRQVVV